MSPKAAHALVPGRARPTSVMFDYTAGDDRPWDARLLRWDVLGSLGHIEGLRASRSADARASTRACARACAPRWPRSTPDGCAFARRRRTCTPRSRTGSPAGCPASASGCTPAARATIRSPPISGSSSRTGCSTLHAGALELAEALLAFAARHRAVLWPGYTHQRRAMPSSVGLWAGAYAEGVLDTAESLAGLWAAVDRSPLGQRRRLRRAAAAQARGRGARARLRRPRPQRGHGARRARQARGGGALLVHPARATSSARLSQDVILFSAEEFGYLRAARRAGDRLEHHAAQAESRPVRAHPRPAPRRSRATSSRCSRSRASWPGGYQRDFQLLKEPLMRGLDRTAAMLAVVAHAVPRLGVDRARCARRARRAARWRPTR